VQVITAEAGKAQALGKREITMVGDGERER